MRGGIPNAGGTHELPNFVGRTHARAYAAHEHRCRAGAAARARAVHCASPVATTPRWSHTKRTWTFADTLKRSRACPMDSAMPRSSAGPSVQPKVARVCSKSCRAPTTPTPSPALPRLSVAVPVSRYEKRREVCTSRVGPSRPQAPSTWKMSRGDAWCTICTEGCARPSMRPWSVVRCMWTLPACMSSRCGDA